MLSDEVIEEYCQQNVNRDLFSEEMSSLPAYAIRMQIHVHGLRKQQGSAHGILLLRLGGITFSVQTPFTQWNSL